MKVVSFISLLFHILLSFSSPHFSHSSVFYCSRFFGILFFGVFDVIYSVFTALCGVFRRRRPAVCMAVPVPPWWKRSRRICPTATERTPASTAEHTSPITTSSSLKWVPSFLLLLKRGFCPLFPYYGIIFSYPIASPSES